MRGNAGEKPEVPKADLVVTLLDRFLSMMRPWVLVGTVLAICLAVYGAAWFLKRQQL
jgi:hypothetical protein